MNKIALSTLTILITTLTINTNIFEEMQVDGYLRAGYEVHSLRGDDTSKDGAIGGKVHIVTAPYLGIRFATSLYSHPRQTLGDTSHRFVHQG